MCRGGGGDGQPNILNPQKIHGPYVVHQKRLELHADYLNHAFGFCGNFGLNCVRTISLAKFKPKKIQELKILDPKNTSDPPSHVYTRVSPPGNCTGWKKVGGNPNNYQELQLPDLPLYKPSFHQFPVCFAPLTPQMKVHAD